jgi:predicted O-methyltransferase YrrM
MTQELWNAVDNYINDLLLPSDPILEAALRASDAAGLPQISVTPSQGKLLQLLAQLKGACNILEIGTLGGYSTIWLARALPQGGRLITLEAESKHAEVAQANIARAGLEGIVDLRLGPALETLPELLAEGKAPFDMIFIDADKPNTPNYFQWAMKLSRKGTLIVVDNVVRKGELADAESKDPNVLGMRRFNEVLAKELRASGTVIQTVCSKGYDGFALILVTSDSHC